MARRYVNPNHRAAPERPDQFADELFDLAWSGHVGEEQGRKLIRAYAREFARRDRDAVGAQVRDQLAPGHMAVYCAASPGCRSVWYRPRCERRS